jgi:3-oxoacyl-[acyl-carrier protein] reductase
VNIRFDGKVVAVSGAARGFGRHIAWRFTELGATVHGCDIARDELPETARRGVVARYVDLTDRAAATAWIHEIETDSPIDILVNNAGGIAGAHAGDIESVSDTNGTRCSTSTPARVLRCRARRRRG